MSQIVAAPPPMARVTTSVQDLRQPSGSSSPTSYTAGAPPHVTCTASAAAGFAAYTFVFVQYDFAASVIASSSTSLLLQPPTASAPLRRSASRNRSGALSASPLIWHEVHTGPALCMLGAGKHNSKFCLQMFLEILQGVAVHLGQSIVCSTKESKGREWDNRKNSHNRLQTKKLEISTMIHQE
jgi:hypothetical protein